MFAIPIILENCFIRIIKIGDVAVEKTFVLDTNVLLQTPYALYSFGDNTIVIPEVVLEELDKFKRKIQN